MELLQLLILLITISAQSCTSHKQCSTACCYSFNWCSTNHFDCYGYANGEHYCSQNYQCKSFNCVSNDCTESTVNKCSAHTDCASGCCDNDYCSDESYCLDYTDGEQCTTNSNCHNYNCINSYCGYTNSSMKPLGFACSKNINCLSGCCSYKECSSHSSCNFYPDGHSCYSNKDCLSENCAGYECKPAINMNTPAIASRLKFILYGLPAISVVILCVGLILMLKCGAKYLVRPTSIVQTPNVLTIALLRQL